MNRHAIIVPVGPNHTSQTMDTIESVLYYSGKDTSVIVIDDQTNDGTFEELERLSDSRLVLSRTRQVNGKEGLHVSVVDALKICMQSGPFSIIMRIDTDALMTGYGICDDALTFFNKNPHVGIIGRHYLNYDGTRKTYETHTKTMNRKYGFPPKSDRWRGGCGWVARMALKNGWGYGENIFGGTYFMSVACVRKMFAMGFFRKYRKSQILGV